MYLFAGASGQALGASLRHGFSLGHCHLLPAFLSQVFLARRWLNQSANSSAIKGNALLIGVFQSSVWLTRQALERERDGLRPTTGTQGVEDLHLVVAQEGCYSHSSFDWSFIWNSHSDAWVALEGAKVVLLLLQLQWAEDEVNNPLLIFLWVVVSEGEITYYCAFWIFCWYVALPGVLMAAIQASVWMQGFDCLSWRGRGNFSEAFSAEEPFWTPVKSNDMW